MACTLWPILHYRDTRRACRFLVDTLGFEEVVVAVDGQDQVVHAELAWPGGGVVVIGGTAHDEGVHAGLGPGTAATYLVCDRVDLAFEQARAGGAVIVEDPRETTFGSGVRSLVATVADPEGNLWTFGSYGGPADG